MAYVSITDELITNVKQKFHLLADAEKRTFDTFDKVTAEISADNPEMLALITAKLWGDLADLEPRLTQYSKTARLDVRVQCSREENGATQVGKYEFGVQNVKLPCFLTVPYNWYDLKVKPDDHPAFAETNRIWALHDECSTRWEAVRNQVETFLRSCKSLNEAIKLWPDVARYIPAEALVRMNRKPEKSQTATRAADALKNVDMAMVTTSTVLARMAGATI